MSKNLHKKPIQKSQTIYCNNLIIILTFVPALIIGVIVAILLFNDYMTTDISKPNPNINYEEYLLEEAGYYSDISDDCVIVGMEFDPFAMENGVYSIYLSGLHEPYQYQGTNRLRGENKDLSTINQQTTFRNFTHKQELIIESARNLVCKYIDDSNVLTDKEWLKEQILTVPFYCYTETSHPELKSTIESPAVHMGIGIYCNYAFANYFSEYMFVHELVHHLRYLTNGKNIGNEMYFAHLFDEALTDVITYCINPALTSNADYVSGYIYLHEPIYKYLSIFKEDALKAFFYGYEDFFEAHGGQAFRDEHNVFVVIFSSYEINYNTPYICEAFFALWQARTISEA